MPHKRAKRSTRELARHHQGIDLPPSSTDGSMPKSALRVLNAAKFQAEWKARKRSRGGDIEGSNSFPADPDGDGGKRKKRKVDRDDQKGDKTVGSQVRNERTADAQIPRIQPGETLGHFNRRVENAMAPLVKSAVHSSSIHTRNVKRLEASVQAVKLQSKPASTEAVYQNNQETKYNRPQDGDAEAKVKIESRQDTTSKQFEGAKPRKLHDVALAPPQLKIGRRIGQGVRSQQDSSESSQRNKSKGVLSMAQRAAMEIERDRVIRLYRELREKQRSDKD